MSSSSPDLHIFFLPFLTPGHGIPMLELAVLISARGARCTVITTSSNAALLLPLLADSNNHNINIITIPISSQNLTNLPTPEITPEYSASLRAIEPHLETLVLAHRPDCLVSDIHFPWTTALANRHAVPRIVFHGTGYFASTVMAIVGRLRLDHSVSNPDEAFLVPGLPHPIRMSRSQIPLMLTSPTESESELGASLDGVHGVVMNTFYELEPAYADAARASYFPRSWHVGPFFLSRRSPHVADKNSAVFRYLDMQKAGSVLYVCFGSLPRFTSGQFRAIGDGLAAAGRPFVWVVRDQPTVDVKTAVGFVMSGWAPQRAILGHGAVGGFMTHCGWNSCLEGVAAGVPMVTWPLFADQQFNERLVVDVLGLGVAVGSTVNSFREEERTAVAAERVAEAVEAVMGGGEAGEERRRRAREMREAAERAVRGGGSSDVELGRMLEGLRALKSRKLLSAESRHSSTSEFNRENP